MFKTYNHLSLRHRAALAAALTLLLFFSLASFGLQRAYEDSLNNAAEGELRAYMLTLIGAIDVSDEGVLSLEDLTVSAFNQPNSGVYAEIWQDQKLIWRSDSLIGQALPTVSAYIGEYQFFSSITGHDVFQKARENNDTPQSVNNILSFKIDWNDGVMSEKFSLVVANDAEPYVKRQQEYKQNLWVWLFGLGFGLVFLQVLLFQWLFRPITAVVEELGSIQVGERSRFSENFPPEVSGLTQSLNVFLDNESRHIQKVKESLANLAHSLKTPLAVIRTELSDKEKGNVVLEEQVDRIATVINYQLNRTSTSVRPSYRQAQPCYDLTHKLLSVMQRLHESKGITISEDVQKELVFKGDVDDLAEVLGNILENACKWASSKVLVRLFNDVHRKLHIQILDDGVGIAKGDIETVLQRGKRLDVQTEGQGIGLSMVSDIIESYAGSIELKPSHEVMPEFKSGLAVLIVV
ncbi:MAG: ATP-binding protein [Arenicella sp.]